MNLIFCTGLEAKVHRNIDYQAGRGAQEDLPGGVARHVQDYDGTNTLFVSDTQNDEMSKCGTNFDECFHIQYPSA
jgi:hypothetical protein